MVLDGTASFEDNGEILWMLGLDVPVDGDQCELQDGIAHAPTREREEKAPCFVFYRAGSDG
jgi:hypothetical protein